MLRCALLFAALGLNSFLNLPGAVTAILLAAPVIGLAQSTNCSACWSNVTQWEGTYNLTLSGSGVDAVCGGSYQANGSSQGSFEISNNVDTITATGSLNVTVSCPGGAVCTVSGSGPLSSYSHVAVVLDLTNCTYTVSVLDVIPIVATYSPCAGTCTYPALGSPSCYLANGTPGRPPSFPLPPFGEALVNSTTYSGGGMSYCFGGNNECSLTISWNVHPVLDNPVPPTFTQLPTGGPLGCNPTNVPNDIDILGMVSVDAASGISSVVATHVDAGPACLTTRTFTIVATDDCEGTQARAVVAYNWTSDTNAPVFTQLPPGGSLGMNPPNIPNDVAALALVEVADDCTVISTNVTHVDGGNVTLSNRTFTITAVDVCTNMATTNVVYSWTTGTGGAPTLKTSFSAGRSGGIVLSWPTNSSGFILQTTTNLLSTNSWVSVTNIPTVAGDRLYVTNGVGGASRFYRLVKNGPSEAMLFGPTQKNKSL